MFLSRKEHEAKNMFRGQLESCHDMDSDEANKVQEVSLRNKNTCLIYVTCPYCSNQFQSGEANIDDYGNMHCSSCHQFMCDIGISTSSQPDDNEKDTQFEEASQFNKESTSDVRHELEDFDIREEHHTPGRVGQQEGEKEHQDEECEVNCNDGSNDNWKHVNVNAERETRNEVASQSKNESTFDASHEFWTSDHRGESCTTSEKVDNKRKLEQKPTMKCEENCNDTSSSDQKDVNVEENGGNSVEINGGYNPRRSSRKRMKVSYEELDSGSFLALL